MLGKLPMLLGTTTPLVMFAHPLPKAGWNDGFQAGSYARFTRKNGV